MDSSRLVAADRAVLVNGDMPSWWMVMRLIGVIRSMRAGIGRPLAQDDRARTPPLARGGGDGAGNGVGGVSQMGPGSPATR